MARQTRAQRRARRAEAGGDGAVQAGRSRPAQQPVVRSAATAPRVEPSERQLPGSGGRRFVSEAWAELKKVEWPRQNQLIQGVVVVLIACIVVGLYLWGADQVFKPLVQKVFLR